jgi:uncharacterized membrane protein (UPF0127 family)
MKAHFLQPLLARDAGPHALRTEDGKACAVTLECAFDSAARRRGLLGRAGLEPGTALVIAPCSAVHTFKMQFAIDVIYAARDGRIVKLRPALNPGRMSGAWGAFATIEMAEGSIARAGLRVGGRLVVSSTGATPAAEPPTRTS